MTPLAELVVTATVVKKRVCVVQLLANHLAKMVRHVVSVVVVNVVPQDKFVVVEHVYHLSIAIVHIGVQVIGNAVKTQTEL